VGRVGPLEPGESRGGEDGQLTAAVGVGFDPLDQSLAAMRTITTATRPCQAGSGAIFYCFAVPGEL
jgi:hypothetical protein